MLLLDKIHEFYKDNLGDNHKVKSIENLLARVLESVLNKSESNLYSQSIQLKAIDLLAYMAHRCSDMERFDLMIEIIGKALNDNTQAPSEQDFISPSNFMVIMNPNEVRSLNRLIELFKLKSRTTESYKSVSIFGTLLEVLKHDSYSKRELIVSQIIQNIKINKHGDLCWMSLNFPLMIGFTEFYKINCCPYCPSSIY